jgi:hypothetical protein
MQYYVIKFVSDLQQVGGRWFSPSTPVSSTNENNCHDITEILLKVTFNTITILTQQNNTKSYHFMGVIFRSLEKFTRLKFYHKTYQSCLVIP